MVHSGLPARRGAGDAQAPDPGHGLANLTRPVGVSPRLLAPNEHLAGTSSVPALLAQLAELRGDASSLTRQHPTVRFLPLPEVLRRWTAAGLDTTPFHAGLAVLRPRYAALGLSRLLPLNRVLVGTHAARTAPWGGFHHPNQGYRHLQMRAIITMQGPLDTGLPADPDLACLDLLRAYAHDCLHYGSYRSYRLDGEDLVRTQYGLNFRRQDGRTYSPPDTAESPTTRNLGVVMEGACDREARLITQAAARRCHITREAGIGRYAYRDVTGTLDTDDLADLADEECRAAIAPGEEASDYLGAMGRYERSVNVRYRAFLAEVGDESAEELHDLVLAAIISGHLRSLTAWLNARRGPGAFAGLFKAAGYTLPRPRTGTG